MILQNKVQTIIDSNQDKNPLLVRNLIKEELQNYVLHFTFAKNRYANLIFTGGTCLRKLYGLNRLSEDLDFDFNDSFKIESFAQEVVTYFKQIIQYDKVSVSIANNKKTVYLKFPLLKDSGMYQQGTPPDLFVRCDFAKNEVGGGWVEQNLVVAGNFQFFVNAYDLPTLFANKIAAFLERVFFKGKQQKLSFKGRDVYDLYWLTSLMMNKTNGLEVNRERLLALLPQYSLDEIEKMVKTKIKEIDDRFLRQDLEPMLEDKLVLENFLNNYKDYVRKYFRVGL